MRLHEGKSKCPSYLLIEYNLTFQIPYFLPYWHTCNALSARELQLPTHQHALMQELPSTALPLCRHNAHCSNAGVLPLLRAWPSPSALTPHPPPADHREAPVPSLQSGYTERRGKWRSPTMLLRTRNWQLRFPTDASLN